jgi:hypothetical protein
MYGSIQWNFIIAAMAGFVSFLVSIASNVFTTAIIQTFYVFGIMFLVVFVFRFLIGLLLTMNIPTDTNLDFVDPALLDAMDKGQNISLSTPDADEYLQDILKQNYTINSNDSQPSDFQPLNPTRLSTAPETQADNLVEAVRSSLRQE